MEIVNLPRAIDPETGLPEVVGNGRVAVIKPGEMVVSRVVELPEPYTDDGKPDMLSKLVATGRLHNN